MLIDIFIFRISFYNWKICKSWRCVFFFIELAMGRAKVYNILYISKLTKSVITAFFVQFLKEILFFLRILLGINILHIFFIFPFPFSLFLTSIKFVGFTNNSLLYCLVFRSPLATSYYYKWSLYYFVQKMFTFFSEIFSKIMYKIWLRRFKVMFIKES